MKFRYISESTFDNKDWSHRGKFDYPVQVIDKFLAGEDVRLGKEGADGTISADLFDKEKLLALRARLCAKDYTCKPDELENCIADGQDKTKVWTKLFKGDFSGYNETHGNQGNIFEERYKNEFDSRYKEPLMDKIGYFAVNGEIQWTGPANNRRPLTIDDKGYLCCFPYGNTNADKYNIGQTVADIVVPTTSGNLYLSLKYGGTVTFVNAGVKKIFPVEAFTAKNPTMFQPIGNALLDLFKINPTKFIEIFNLYCEEPTLDEKVFLKVKDEDEVKDKIDKDKLLSFVKSVIGYGYILVHEDAKGTVHIYDVRTAEGLKKLLGGKDGTEEDLNPKSVTVLYPKEYNGKTFAKRIDIEVDYKNIKLKFNIRAKDGGIYPTHIMSDYVIKNV